MTGRAQTLAVREAVKLLRRAGLEVIVSCSNGDGIRPQHWLIHAEPPQGMRHKGDDKLARQIAERVVNGPADDPAA